jgi:nucleotide-binding universal stress UspA family protein
MRAMLALDGGATDHDIAAAAAFVLVASRDQAILLTVVHPDRIYETPAELGTGRVGDPQATAGGHTLPVAAPPSRAAEGRDQAIARVYAEREAYLNSIGARYLGDIRFEAHVEVAADAAQAILSAIDRAGIQGLAMGTRSERSRLGSALFGSVSEEVIRRASIPVLVAKQGTLVPADESDASG